MKVNDVFLRGLVFGGVGGGVAGAVLAVYLCRRRHEAELQEVRDLYRAKAKKLEREYALASFEVLPTLRTRSFSESENDVPGYPDVEGVLRFAGIPEELFRDDSSGYSDVGQVITEELTEGLREISLNGPDGDIDPLAGLDDSDYEPGAATSLGVDGNGDPVEDEFLHEADGPEHEQDDEDGPSAPDPRGPGPYLITHDEFFGHRKHYAKLTIMYYRASNDLCDDQEVPIPDVRGTIGLGTTDKFGQNADEPNILYVRNNKMETDFEVCLDYGSYTEKVLGYGTASPKPPRRMYGE
jgi:hypothetical protein